MDDYLELPLYIEDLPDGKILDLWVISEKNRIFGVFKNVDSCIRYKGWWSLSHVQAGMKMTAMIPSDQIVYFNILERDDETFEKD